MKIYVISALLSALLILSSCVGGFDDLSPTIPSPASAINLPTSSPSDRSALALYRSVLLGDTNFLEIDLQKSIDITAFSDVNSNPLGEVDAKIIRFSIIDLDDDGAPEIVLWIGTESNEHIGFEILRYQGEEIYGYTRWYRWFSELKADGTFTCSNSGADWWVGKISFQKDGYAVDESMYCQQNDSGGESYVVKGVAATEAEFLAASDQQGLKENATWYDFNESNIETMLSDTIY